MSKRECQNDKSHISHHRCPILLEHNDQMSFFWSPMGHPLTLYLSMKYPLKIGRIGMIQGYLETHRCYQDSLMIKNNDDNMHNTITKHLWSELNGFRPRDGKIKDNTYREPKGGLNCATWISPPRWAPPWQNPKMRSWSPDFRKNQLICINPLWHVWDWN